MVVWAHLSGYWLFLNNQQSGLQNLFQQWVVVPLHVYQNGGNLGVVIFFLISGYIITHTSMRETRGSFVVKRVMRLAPALLVALLVTVVVVHAIHGLPGFTAAPWYKWIEAGFLVDGFGSSTFALSVTWTLVVELIFYVMVFALLATQKRKPLRSTWIMAAGWFVGSYLFLELPVFSGYANGWAMFYVAFLLIGRLIYLTQMGRVRPVDAAVLGAFLLTIFCVFVETSQPGFLLAPGGWHGVEPVLAYIFGILIFLGFLRWGPRRAIAPFEFLGNISYSLYLLHLPVGFAVLWLLNQIDFSRSLSTVIAIFVAIGVSFVSYRLVERPAQRLTRWILSRPRRVPAIVSVPDRALVSNALD